MPRLFTRAAKDPATGAYGTYSVRHDLHVNEGQAAIEALHTPNLSIVASSNAPQAAKDNATRVCDGTADNVEIQAELDAGNDVWLVGKSVSSGALVAAQFNLAASVVLKYHGQALVGEGLDATKLSLVNGLSGVFAVTNSVPSGGSNHWGLLLARFTVDANMNNQSGSSGAIKLDRPYFADLHQLRLLNTRSAALWFFSSNGNWFAYSEVRNVTCATGLGHGIILDANGEFQKLYGVNSSFYQGGTITSTLYDDPNTDAGIALYVKSGNNEIHGGHLDRARIPLMLEFAHGNYIHGKTDNALETSVAIKGSHKNTLVLQCGRMDPQNGDVAGAAATNPRYNTRRSVNITNTSAGNRIRYTQLDDTAAPSGFSNPNPYGGWLWQVAENNGAGTANYGGRNEVEATPSLCRVVMDGSRRSYEITTSRVTTGTNNPLNNEEAQWPQGGESPVWLYANPTGGAITLELPLGSAAYGRIFRIKNIHASNNVTIQPRSGDSIAGGNITLAPGQNAVLVGPQDDYSNIAVWQRW